MLAFLFDGPIKSFPAVTLKDQCAKCWDQNPMVFVYIYIYIDVFCCVDVICCLLVRLICCLLRTRYQVRSGPEKSGDLTYQAEIFVPQAVVSTGRFEAHKNTH